MTGIEYKLEPKEPPHLYLIKKMERTGVNGK